MNLSSKLNRIIPSEREEEIWYTDGSEKGNLAGAGVCTRSRGNGIVIALGRNGTIRQAKLRGIETASQLAVQAGSPKMLHVDSEIMADLTASQNMTTESNPGMPQHSKQPYQGAIC